jgi:hypothetical protein
MALAYATPDIHNNLAPISKYQWTESIYGQKYSTLPPTGVGLTKAKVDAEYQKFVEETDKKTYMR